MLFVTRLARTLLIFIFCLATVGCGSGDTTPESEIPDIPPSTRTMPGESGDSGGQEGAVPAQPTR